jgi:beta-lactam-binding protein with PASTA domain
MVPDVRGRSLQDAQAKLTRLGWSVSRVDSSHGEAQPTDVVSLQFPAPGGPVQQPGALLLAVQ